MGCRIIRDHPRHPRKIPAKRDQRSLGQKEGFPYDRRWLNFVGRAGFRWPSAPGIPTMLRLGSLTFLPRIISRIRGNVSQV
jgi:hypothetical protein